MSANAAPGRHAGATPYDAVMDISPPRCERCSMGMRSPNGWRAVIHMNAYGAPQSVGLLCPDCPPGADTGMVNGDAPR